MHFSPVRVRRNEPDSNTYQAALDELLAAAVARRQNSDAQSGPPARRPSLEDWPTVGEGFTWNSGERSDGAKRGGSHALRLRQLAFLLIVAVAVACLLF